MSDVRRFWLLVLAVSAASRRRRPMRRPIRRWRRRSPGRSAAPPFSRATLRAIGCKSSPSSASGRRRRWSRSGPAAIGRRSSRLVCVTAAATTLPCRKQAARSRGAQAEARGLSRALRQAHPHRIRPRSPRHRARRLGRPHPDLPLPAQLDGGRLCRPGARRLRPRLEARRRARHRGRPCARRPAAGSQGGQRLVRQDYAVMLAEQAGLRFIAASDINANPRDTKDWPKGVWTCRRALRWASRTARSTPRSARPTISCGNSRSPRIRSKLPEIALRTSQEPVGLSFSENSQPCGVFGFPVTRGPTR